MSEVNRTFELGKLYSDRGEFTAAVEQLKNASMEFFAKKQFSEFMKCQNLLLRIYAEQEKYEEINSTKEILQDLVLKQGLELNSKTFYTLALCSHYKNQFESAHEYIQKALALALSSDNKEDICRAILGVAMVYASPTYKKYAEALKEIYNLDVFFQVIDLPDVKASALMLNAFILQQLKKYDEALQVIWKAYDIVRETKNVVMGSYLTLMLADVSFELGDKDLARTYLFLASKSVDTNEQIRLAHVLRKYQEKIGGTADLSYDLVFDETNHAVLEKRIGKIDLKNQFILLDLLKLFVQNPGTVYSKEFLVENVWKQPYDPSVHDNKIYVTIKRLRKMIEPDYEKPKYIFRAKNGYYLNKSARVQIQH